MPHFLQTPYPSERDDNPAAHPQNYRLSELQFDYTLPNPYGGAAIARRSHTWQYPPPRLPEEGSSQHCWR